MKKLLIITITICMVFVLTACSTKKTNSGGNGLIPTDNTEKKEDKKDVIPASNVKYLECVKDYSERMSNNIKMEQEVYIKFVDNKIDTMSMSMNFELPSNLSSTADTFVNTMKKTYDDKYGIYDGVKVELERDSNREFSVVITMDFQKLDSTARTGLGISGSEDYTVNRNSFVKEGYTCK